LCWHAIETIHTADADATTAAAVCGCVGMPLIFVTTLLKAVSYTKFNVVFVLIHFKWLL